MKKSGVIATSNSPTKQASNTTIDSTKAKFFYQGLFALKRLQNTNKSDKSVSPSKKTNAY
jgi:hypothetical protein